jgi:hypothetical protein
MSGRLKSAWQARHTANDSSGHVPAGAPDASICSCPGEPTGRRASEQAPIRSTRGCSHPPESKRESANLRLRRRSLSPTVQRAAPFNTAEPIAILREWSEWPTVSSSRTRTADYGSGDRAAGVAGAVHEYRGQPAPGRPMQARETGRRSVRLQRPRRLQPAVRPSVMTRQQPGCSMQPAPAPWQRATPTSAGVASNSPGPGLSLGSAREGMPSHPRPGKRQR